MAITYPIILSTTEPNNNIGLLKIRQADEETQTLIVEVLEHGVPLSYEGLQIFFCAKIGQSEGLGIIEQKLMPNEMTNPRNGRFEYTFRDQDWQILGRQTAYFSFRRMVDDHTYVQQFSTRDFTYEVTKNVYSDGIKEVKTDGSTYVWTFEDLLRLLQEFKDSGESDFLTWFDQIKDQLSEDAAGNLMLLYQSIEKELSDATGEYTNLGEKLDSINNTFGGITTAFWDNEDVRNIFIENVVNMRRYLSANQSNVNIASPTDIHFSQYGIYWGPVGSAATGITHIQNVAAVSDLLDFGIQLGDNCDYNSSGDKHIAMQQQRAFATSWFSSLVCPCAILKGNHDDNSGFGTETSLNATGMDYILRDEDFANLYRQNTNLFGEVRKGESNYFYYDVPGKNVRIIGLDSYQTVESLGSDNKIKYPRQRISAFQKDQIEFLYNALNDADGKHVAIFTHCPLSGVFQEEPNAINHQLILELINGFKNANSGTLISTVVDYEVNLPYSFSSQGTIVGCFYGHHHLDDLKEYRGVNHVRLDNCFGSNGPQTSSTYVGWWNTDKEDAFRVISIDTTLKTVHTEKFGERGISFDFSY